MSSLPRAPFSLPGLVDMHVHLRDPGQTHKEDFASGTAAALAGGFTTVFDMPNNVVPVTSGRVLREKRELAAGRVRCDVGFYFGSLGENTGEFSAVRDQVYGLKLYLNHTTGGYRLDTRSLVGIFSAWDSVKPVLLHAEADTIGTAMDAALETGQAVHVCHVSSRAELESVLRARAVGVNVTCGVTPHHLFLTEEDGGRLGPFGEVRPMLKPKEDVRYLWEHLGQIDVVESDHAPHTVADKRQGAFGFPGLETTLPLLLGACAQGEMTLEDVVEKCSRAPRRILGLDPEPDSVVEIDPGEFCVDEASVHSRAGWTPFAGTRAVGRVLRVTVRGTVVVDEGRVLAAPGSGSVL